MTAITLNPADILDRGADEIARRGLGKDFYIDPDVDRGTACVCALGAMSLAATGEPNPADSEAWDSPAFREAIERLASHIEGPDHFSIDEAKVIWWNDRVHRTADQVITAMRAAALEIREGCDA